MAFSTDARRFCFLAVILAFPAPLVFAAESHRPRVVLIGDSTVKCGSGKGGGGMWGWGNFLDNYFDASRIEIQNRALGGRSSRTYLTEGLWARSLERLRPGDYVLMQFGHNDGGEKFKGDRPRASIKGNGDETVDGVVEATGKQETVRSYGWYLRKYIADAKDKGAVPIVLSLIPRNRWEDDRVIRAGNDYGRWAREAARDGDAFYIDLNEIVARRYEDLGQEAVARDMFTEKDWTHTSEAGARLNAACVATGIRGLKDCALSDFLLPEKESSLTKDSVSQPTERRFDFGEGRVAAGYQAVSATTAYSPATGYGFEPGSEVANLRGSSTEPLDEDACGGDSPFYFSVALPEGNYRVKVSADGDAPLTVKAELRRLMIENWIPQRPGDASREFLVNVRRPQLPDGRSVKLKPRELQSEAPAWDEKLTLEFNGQHASITALAVSPASDAATLFLAGDSTVADQPREPWNSWGQMLPRFIGGNVVVANHSESGESIRSSLSALRFEKIFSLIKPGDYLMIQFGHNDMKDQRPDALAVYQSNLVDLVEKARSLSAGPILVTSMERKPGPQYKSLGDYPQTVRDVAAELSVPLIDLNAMSRQLYEAMGDDVDRAFQDGTHHTNYGSYQLAKCVVQGLRDNKIDLATAIVADFDAFDVSSPDSFDAFSIPPSPRQESPSSSGN